MIDGKKTVLIVEDEKSLNNILSDTMANTGFHVHAAQNGEEGLSVALKIHPEIILLDVIMPVMDGITMLRKLREDEWGKNAKVILLTNLSDSKKVAEIAEENSIEYLVKSNWKMKDIVEKVKKELQ